MFEFDLVQCGLIVLILMVAGEVISHKMHAVIPSILASTTLLMLLVWSHILPADVIETSGLITLASIATMFSIICMGISTKPKELMDNWRVVALSAASYVGQVLILFLVICLIFGSNYAIGALPGGAAVALIIQERAKALGHEDIVVLSVLLVSIQGLVACPIVSIMLKKEIRQMRKDGLLIATASISDSSAPNASSVPDTDSSIPDASPVPDADSSVPATATAPAAPSPLWSLLRLYVVAWISSRLELYTEISRYVYCLLLGVLFAQIGFLPKDEMDRSKSQGFLNLMMLTVLLNGITNATPEMFVDLLFPLICILLVDVVSIFLLSIPLGKLLRFSKPMSFAICLNVMIGFPLNLMLVQDIIDFLVEKPEEKKILNQQIGTKMIIGGFTV